VRSGAFLDKLEGVMGQVQGAAPMIESFVYSNPLYVGFGHQNGNTDNAYFYRDTHGVLECGILDWGSTGHMSYAHEFMGSFGSALGEMMAEYEERLMQCFADAHNATGAPEIDAAELTLHLRLVTFVNTYRLLGIVMPFNSEKHQHGKPFWKTVKSYNDDLIRSNFTLKFGVSMLYNKVLLLFLRMEDYLQSVDEWVGRMGWK